MKNVLIADDEKPFLQNLVRGFKEFPDNFFNVWAAENGKIAMEILRNTNIDLVITDLKMPVMDGFELLTYINRNHPSTPVLVMTGFNSPELKNKLESLGISQFIEKPLKFHVLLDKITEKLKSCSDLSDHRIDLYTFLFLVEMKKMNCTLTIRSDDKTGQLFFQKGKLIDAEFDFLTGEEAAYEIFGWDNQRVDMDNHCARQEKKIDHPLILLEGLRSNAEKPERRKTEITATEINGKDHLQLTASKEQELFEALKEVIVMAVQDKLKELSSIEGFVGAGLFTPTGESLALLASDDKVNIKDIGVLANNVLRNAQKASLDMGTGRGQLVHVEAENAHIIVRCLNEGNDPLKSESGKAHIHLVLVLSSESSLGLAKLKVGSAINSLAPEFRS